MPIPRTHDLVDLLMRVVNKHPHLIVLRRGLTVLSRYAVEARYPGFRATKRQAASGIRWATQVRDACRAALQSGVRREFDAAIWKAADVRAASVPYPRHTFRGSWTARLFGFFWNWNVEPFGLA